MQIELLLCLRSVLDAGYRTVKKHGKVFVPGQLRQWAQVGRDCMIYLQAHFIKNKNKQKKKSAESRREWAICLKSQTG